ncbi:hypothetical protein F11_08025 [Rhodospirillum rubrum F11]|nr:hypothetical protein F11_08025 [Rhodospirillum rubrum F11]
MVLGYRAGPKGPVARLFPLGVRAMAVAVSVNYFWNQDLKDLG